MERRKVRFNPRYISHICQHGCAHPVTGFAVKTIMDKLSCGLPPHCNAPPLNPSFFINIDTMPVPAKFGVAETTSKQQRPLSVATTLSDGSAYTGQ